MLSQFVDIRRLSDRIAVARELNSKVVGSDQQNIGFVCRATNAVGQREGNDNDSQNQASHDVSPMGVVATQRGQPPS
jgi:hypothetical protein